MAGGDDDGAGGLPLTRGEIPERRRHGADVPYLGAGFEETVEGCRRKLLRTCTQVAGEDDAEWRGEDVQGEGARDEMDAIGVMSAPILPRMS